MHTATYHQRRSELATYFDRTAVAAWSRLTSEAPVGRIRATVRAGRAEMRDTLLGWLPEDLTGRRVLDAGCGTGLFAIEAARHGAEVVAVDLSPTLIGLARERLPKNLDGGRISFQVGDMLNEELGVFDHVVAMDSLIHYRAPEMVALVAALAARARQTVAITFAPRTLPLTLMHATGKLFPRGNRSPAIEPIREARLRQLIAGAPSLSGFAVERSRCISRGFYISQALEVRRT